MATFIVYLLIAGAVLYLIFRQGKLLSSQNGVLTDRPKSRKPGFKRDSREIWKQVYETASMEEAHLIRVRLEEEDIECILYEQGKKDIHGNLLKGVGVAVPATAASRAQASIARMPV